MIVSIGETKLLNLHHESRFIERHSKLGETLSLYGKRSYWPPETKKVDFFQKSYCKVKLSAQTH